MSKIVAIPIDVENHFKIFRTKKVLKLILDLELRGWELYQLCYNGSNSLTIDFLQHG